MKRLLLIALVLPFIFGLAWHTANQATIGWDEVTKIKPGDSYVYIVYKKNLDGTGQAELARIPHGTTRATITFTTEGRMIVGVDTERTVDVNDDGVVDDLDKDVEGFFVVMTSGIVNWSDVNGVMTPNPFGLQYFVKPVAPLNLHVE